jgi:hypothetical protein
MAPLSRLNFERPLPLRREPHKQQTQLRLPLSLGHRQPLVKHQDRSWRPSLG